MNIIINRRKKDSSKSTTNKTRIGSIQYSAKSLPTVSETHNNWALNMLEEIDTNHNKDLILRHDIKEDNDNCIGFFSIVKNFFCSSRDN